MPLEQILFTHNNIVRVRVIVDKPQQLLKEAQNINNYF